MSIKVTKNLSTKVLSARVTPDVYVAWNNLAKTQNKTVSEVLRDAVTMVDKKAILKAEDGILVPNDLRNVLGAIGGGSVAAILVYKGIRTTLMKSNLDMTENDIETISFLLALSSAMLIGTGVYKALRK